MQLKVANANDRGHAPIQASGALCVIVGSLLHSGIVPVLISMALEERPRVDAQVA